MLRYTIRVLLLISILFPSACDKPAKWYKPREEGLLVAHALGGIAGLTYTNSKEAFLFNYENGRRWFEVDLALTRDLDLVCYHGITIGMKKEEINHISTSNFLEYKIKSGVGILNLLTFEDLLMLIKSKSDVFLITDTKGWSHEKMNAMLRHIKRVDSSLISHIIPQIYKPDDIILIKETEKREGKFASLIFTLYLSDMTNDNVIKFVNKENIPIVTMPPERIAPSFIKRLHRKEVYVFTHTINKTEDIMDYRKKGIDGFYTDFYLDDKPG